MIYKVVGCASRLFGDVSGVWNWVVFGVCLVMGLHLLGVFKFTIPMPLAIQPKTQGALGALLLGDRCSAERTERGVTAQEDAEMRPFASCVTGIRAVLGMACLSALTWVAACDQKSKAVPPTPAAEPAPVVAATRAKASVATVVFVGQKDCCQCTQERIDHSWAALEQALKAKPDVAVERLQIDVDEAQMSEIEKLGKTMVVPGLYFLAADGGLIEHLQGEVTSAQIAQVL